MSLGIQIRIETQGSRWNTKEALENFWYDLSNGVKAQCRGKAGNWLKRNYISEIYIEEHEVLEDGFTIFFNNPGGMCDVSSAVTLHIAQLILAHNVEKFAKRFKRIDYTLVSSFGSVKEVQSEQESLYFDYNGVLYGILLPLNDFSKINDHLISDSGFEITFEQLPVKQKKLIETMVENKSCQCFVCKKVAKNTLKHISFV